jgi:hypothetical protein
MLDSRRYCGLGGLGLLLDVSAYCEWQTLDDISYTVSPRLLRSLLHIPANVAKGCRFCEKIISYILICMLNATPLHRLTKTP